LTDIADGYATDPTFAGQSDRLLSSSLSTDTSDFGASASQQPSLDAFYSPQQLNFITETRFEFAPGLFRSSSNEPSVVSPSHSYPTPTSTTSETQNRSPATDVTTLPSPIRECITVHRRRPGRPPCGARSKHTKDPNFVTRLHNESASRSRGKLSTTLDKLWAQIPEQERRKKSKELHSSRPLAKAEKVEIVLGYVRQLQDKVKEQYL
jgi:hypothetical protein